jgi:hypothetical protein
LKKDSSNPGNVPIVNIGAEDSKPGQGRKDTAPAIKLNGHSRTSILAWILLYRKVGTIIALL